jgi:hypothetical protein
LRTLNRPSDLRRPVFIDFMRGKSKTLPVDGVGRDSDSPSDLAP